MVVGIYSLPDGNFPKRRCSDGSANLLPCARPNKRWKAENAEETEVILEAPEAAEPLSSVVLLEENGGIWHVDGLLELLAGALCATFGADPLDMTCASDGGSTSCTTADAAPPSLQTSKGTHDSQYLDSHGLACQSLPTRQTPPTAKLTERNLQAHTASSASSPLLTSPCPSNLDDEDRSSVASLSAWVVGTQSPRRRVSDAGSQFPAAGAATAFSFTPRCSGGGGGGSPSSNGIGGSSSSGGGGEGSPSLDSNFLETRCPRRRLSASATSTRL